VAAVERLLPKSDKLKQMKTAWDSYLDRQLADPTVRRAFEEETQVLSIGLQLANQPKKQGLTQAELA